MKKFLSFILFVFLCNPSYSQNNLIKTDDNSIFYEVEGKELYHFAGSTFNKKGVKNASKKLIIPQKYYYISYRKGIFECNYGFLDSEGIDFYDKTGRLIIPASSKISRVTPVFLNDKEYYEIEKFDRKGIFDTKTMKMIVPPYYNMILTNNRDYFQVIDERDLTGIYTDSGTKVVPCQYNEIQQKNGFYFVKRGIFEGVVTSDGKEIIPPLQFLKVSASNGYFIVQKEGKRNGGYKGVFDSSGKCIIFPDKYTDIKVLSNGMFMVKKGHDTGVCDNDGKELFVTKYTDLEMSNGKTYFVTYIGKNKGVMRLNGDIIIEPESKSSKSKFKNFDLFCLINEKGFYGLTDAQGHVVLPAKYDNLRLDKYYCYPSLNGKESLYTHDGKMIIPDEKFHSVEFDMTSEYIKVMLNNKMGLYTMDGKPIFEPYKYDNIEEFSDMRGTYKVYQGDLMGLVDSKGNIILPMKYTNVYRPNKEGRNVLKKSDFDYLEVRLFDKYGICDLNGNEIIPSVFTHIYSYLEYGLFKVIDGSKEGLYTKDGKEIVPARRFSSVKIHTENGKPTYIHAEDEDWECKYDLQGNLLSENKIIPKEFYDNINRASYYFDKKEYNTAIDYYIKSLNYKQDCESYFNIGLCYYILDRFSKAIENFELCLANNPYQSLKERAEDLIESSNRIQTGKRANRNKLILTFLGALAGTFNAVMQANYYRNANANYRDGSFDYLLDPRYAAMQVQQQNYSEYLQMTNGGQTMTFEEWYTNIKSPALAEEYGHKNESFGDSFSSSSSSSQGSSSQLSTSTKSCRFCAGLGSCKTCGGRGYYYNPLDLSKTVICPNCKNHDGLCTHCGGTGYN